MKSTRKNKMTSSGVPVASRNSQTGTSRPDLFATVAFDFQGFIDPPISYNPAQDNRLYRVRIAVCVDNNSPDPVTYYIPVSDHVTDPNGLAPLSAESWQIQTVGVTSRQDGLSPIDSPDALYYMTNTIIQRLQNGQPGMTIRHRIFITPSASSTIPNNMGQGDILFQKLIYITLSNNTKVTYSMNKISSTAVDPTPEFLFLQQPE